MKDDVDPDKAVGVGNNIFSNERGIFSAGLETLMPKLVLQV